MQETSLESHPWRKINKPSLDTINPAKAPTVSVMAMTQPISTKQLSMPDNYLIHTHDRCLLLGVTVSQHQLAAQLWVCSGQDGLGDDRSSKSRRWRSRDRHAQFTYARPTKSKQLTRPSWKDKTNEEEEWWLILSLIWPDDAIRRVGVDNFSWIRRGRIKHISATYAVMLPYWHKKWPVQIGTWWM